MAITGSGGPQGCETSRLTHFLDNRVIDGSEVVSHKSPLSSGRFLRCSFLLKSVSAPGICAAVRIKCIEKSYDPIGNRTRNLPACSIVPQTATLPLALI
jgi:hypothetical protein